MPNAILIVEDELAIAENIAYALRTEGFAPHHVALGELALSEMRSADASKYQLIVLDVGLPDINGFEVCRRLRQFSDVPVIFLTARSDEIDRVVGLEIGADDYVTKPFSPRELVARIRVILRRIAPKSPSEKPMVVQAPAFELRELEARILFHGRTLDLTRYEYLLLKTFLEKPGHVLSRAQLMDHVWEDAPDTLERTVDAHIKSLRGKLRMVDADDDPIQTHRGMGYSLDRLVKIGLRILLGYFLIVGLAAWFLLNVFVEEVKPGVRDTLEDTLADTANLLAKEVVDDVKLGTLQQSALVKGMQGDRNVVASIHGVNKQTLDYRITVTNDHGIVLFDSNGQDVGKDYSRWNDVNRTLHGTYGARSTRGDPNDAASSVMHVAAPVLDNGKIIGVLTVSKPISTVQPFVERSQRKILQRGVVLLASSLLIGLAFAFWLSRELRKLQSYASSVEAGEKVALPNLGNNEIGALGRALDSMRNKLEGKEYVEELMHTLAHELKSPIAAIQGSAELLREEMPEAERQRFLRNILEQNQRQKQLIDKLLSLITVEKQQQLAATTLIPIGELIGQVEADCAAKLASKAIRLNKNVVDYDLRGDALLLRQALGNLLDNAIDFSTTGGLVAIDAAPTGQGFSLRMTDHGTGIPEYAIARVFERFYSLARPNGAKSTGLGLPFVREVILLHGGTISIDNHADGGTCVYLYFPIL